MIKLPFHKLLPDRDDRDSRHRQLVLAMLLSGLILLTGICSSMATFDWVVMQGDYHGIPPIAMWSGLILIGVLWLFSRKRPRLVAYALTGFIAVLGTVPLLIWGTYTPQGLLIYALVIVLAGALIGGRASVIFLGITTVLLISLTFLLQSDRLPVGTSWFDDGSTLAGVVPFVATLAAIATVAWLSNREIDRAFECFETAASELAAERDSLQEKVTERTRQLEQAQLEQEVELHRFAEFGRLTSGVVHDLANPLTAISANLSCALDSREDESLHEVIGATKYVERYINALRNQLQAKSEIRNFKTQDEIAQVVGVLAYKARQCKVEVSFSGKATAIYGDPVKFNQIIANLIANALDAYSTSQVAKERIVHISTFIVDNASVIKVEDRAGGISTKSLSTIFAPFYTSSPERRGIGIGLTMVKRYVEQDFGGTIHVEKVDKDGTAFIITIPTRKPAITGLAAT